MKLLTYTFTFPLTDSNSSCVPVGTTDIAIKGPNGKTDNMRLIQDYIAI